MQLAQINDHVLRQVRARICPKCPRCPQNEAFVLGDTARSCETTCELSRQLPELTRIALMHDPMLNPDQSMLVEIIGRCEDRRECGAMESNPLYVFREDLVDILASSTRGTAKCRNCLSADCAKKRAWQI